MWKSNPVTSLSALISLGLLASGMSWSGTARASGDDVKALRSQLQTILQAPELEDALAGVHVLSLSDGRSLFSHNAEKLFNPASNMKLPTTAAALWHLGANYRFRTESRRDAQMVNGVVHGNLYVKGYGDPTLTTEEIFGLVNQIALKGIREIRGHLIVDDTFFDTVREGPGWEQEIGDHAYAAPVGALSINFNTFEIHVLPGERYGDPAQVKVWPDVPSVEVVVNASTRGRGSRARLWIGTTRLPQDRIRVTVRGYIPSNATEGRLVRRRVHDPSRFAGEMIERMLEMRGVRVRGRVKMGTVPKSGTVHVATHWSRPLAEIVSTLNKYSNNFMAEQILKTLGAELYSEPGSWAAGNRAVAEFLNEIGIDTKTVVLANGSGLNDTNRLTPTQITRILQAMYQHFELRAEFVASLAVAGNSGTITSRFDDSPAEARLRAKTGSLTGVSALSGYVVTQSNEVLAFSVMMNDYHGRARTMWRIQDRIGITLAQFRGTQAVAAGASTPSVNAP